MKNIFIYSLLVTLFLIGCTKKLKDGTYYLKYVYKGEVSNNIGAQDQELQIEKDKIKLVVYEPYLEPINGVIKNDKIIFDNGDTVKFKIIKDGLETFDGELVYSWSYKR